MAKEQFFYPESADLLKTLDEAARRSGVSRGQAFEDFLHMTVCSLSGQRMEEQYMTVVKKHSQGKPGRRGCDSIAELFAKSVAAMESDETRGEMKDFERWLPNSFNGKPKATAASIARCDVHTVAFGLPLNDMSSPSSKR